MKPSLRAAGALGGDLLFYGLMWAGLGAAVLALGLGGGAIWGDPDGSVWEGTASIFQYAMLGAGIMVGASYLPIYITHGITRRDFTVAALTALVGLALGGALATTIGFGIEHLVFEAAGWPHVLDDAHEMHIYDRPDEFGLILVELFGLYVTHAVAGLLIVTGLFRLGWLYGSAFVVAGTAVAVGAEMALGSGFAGVVLLQAFDLDAPPVAAGVAVAAGLTVLGALLARALIAGMQIDTKDAAWWR